MSGCEPVWRRGGDATLALTLPDQKNGRGVWGVEEVPIIVAIPVAQEHDHPLEGLRCAAARAFTGSCLHCR